MVCYEEEFWRGSSTFHWVLAAARPFAFRKSAINLLRSQTLDPGVVVLSYAHDQLVNIVRQEMIDCIVRSVRSGHFHL